MRQRVDALIRAATADETRALGARLADAILAVTDARSDSLCVTLTGELGAGKTTFVGGLLSALGHDGPARSPTYTLIEPYRLGGRDLYHCDLYRLRHPDEFDDLGLRDLSGPGSVVLVEWPERAEGRLGAADLAIRITYEGEGRAFDFDGLTERGRQLADRLSGRT